MMIKNVLTRLKLLRGSWHVCVSCIVFKVYDFFFFMENTVGISYFLNSPSIMNLARKVNAKVELSGIKKKGRELLKTNNVSSLILLRTGIIQGHWGCICYWISSDSWNTVWHGWWIFLAKLITVFLITDLIGTFHYKYIMGCSSGTRWSNSFNK